MSLARAFSSCSSHLLPLYIIFFLFPPPLPHLHSFTPSLPSYVPLSFLRSLLPLVSSSFIFHYASSPFLLLYHNFFPHSVFLSFIYTTSSFSFCTTSSSLFPPSISPFSSFLLPFISVLSMPAPEQETKNTKKK